MFIVTDEWVMQFRTPAGGWRRKQLAAVGVAWPPKAGWKRALDGTIISDEQRAKFEKESRQPPQFVRAMPDRKAEACTVRNSPA